MPESGAGETGSLRPARRRAWTYVGLMMVCILLTLPTTPILWRTALKIFGPAVNVVGYVIFLFLFAAFFVYMIRRRRETGTAGILALAGFGLIYFCLLKYQCQFPAERLHLIEYGLLAYLSYRALRLDFREAKAYIMGFLISSGFGLFDEAVQYVLPNRVFEVRDAMTNVLAASVGLLAVRVLLRPDSSGVSSSKVER